MSTRRDYLGTECDLGGLSLADFQEAFCGRCAQPECTRSLFGKSRFDQRVHNWEERLFTNIPRMDPSDPRFVGISGQRFVSVQTSPPGVKSDWVDPRDVKETASIVVPAAVAPSRSRALPVLNTPFQNGTMLPGAPTTTPVADAWAAPEAPKERVLKPGSKIKLGG